jgi:DNA-binding NarL/FixJ family response regulator
MHAESDVARRLREAGAVAYLPKSGPTEDLLEVIRHYGRKDSRKKD